jgi:hypothetical protein
MTRRVEADRSPRLDEPHAGQWLQIVRLAEQHGDLVAVPVLQAAALERGQPADRATRTGVEHSGPHQLLPGERTGRRTDDHVAHELPPLCSDLDVHVVTVVPEGDQLAAGEEP